MKGKWPALLVMIQMSSLLMPTTVWGAGYTRFTERGCLAPLSSNGSWLIDEQIGVVGDQIEGVDQETVSAVGNAIIFYQAGTISAPRIDFQVRESLIESQGPVCFTDGDSRIEGSHLTYQYETEVGSIDHPIYQFQITRRIENEDREITVGGFGEKILFEGKDRYRILGCRFTSCEGDNPAWYLMADEIEIDTEKNIGEAFNARVYFKDVPILGLPWLSFPLDNQRRSGFLAPYITTSSRSGFSAGLPYYWNIAPNYDATITPSYSTRRGPKIDTEFRYLFEDIVGSVSFDYVPQDLEKRTDRYAFILNNHYSNIEQGIDFRLLYNSVSDLEYFSDFSNRIQQMTQSTLPREGVVDYYLPVDWAMGRVGLIVQRFQVLDPEIGYPYERTPQVFLELIGENEGALDWTLDGEFTYFRHRDAVEGKRTVLYPTISLPLTAHPGVTVTPKIGLHARHYALSSQRSWHQDDTIRKTIPISSVDAKAVFERNTHLWGRSYHQTLEPRLFYLYVPDRYQDDIPIFDTGLMDANFATIFSENIYSGQDRIADANDLTLGLTSRLIDSWDGRELVKATIAQRIYFDKQHIGLPEESLRSDRRSDLLAGLAGEVIPNVTVNTLFQYGMSDATFRQIVLGVQYRPEPGKAVSVGQRYYDGQYHQMDLAGQWPINRMTRLVGRYSYSFRDNRNVETLLGVEYDSDCWTFRVVGQRIQTVLGSPTTAFFAQLELVGLGHIGNNPMNILRRSIPGYQVFNDIRTMSPYEINRY